MNIPLAVGTKAPDFSLPIGNGNTEPALENTFKLSDRLGKNVILSFYPADFSTVCSSQIALYNELLPIFSELNALCVGISVDGNYCHNAFKKFNNLNIDLLCDFHPKGQVAKMYQSYNEDFGFCERAIYVIDKEGSIAYSFISPLDVNPGAKEILETLKKLNS